MKATESNRYDLFPASVGVIHFAECEGLNTKILDEINAVDWDAHNKAQGRRFDASHTHAEDTFIDLELVPSCKQVLQAFLANCNQFAKELAWNIDPNKTEITGFWAHITEPGKATSPHRHLSCHGINHFSGVYYVRVPKGCGELFFSDDRLVRSYEPNPNSRCQGFHVKEGQMVLFPSWLTHHVGVNASGETRVSISFNAHVIPI